MKGIRYTDEFKSDAVDEIKERGDNVFNEAQRT